MVKASASRAVDLDLILSRVKPMTSKLVPVFTASPLEAQHHKNSMKNKPASFFLNLFAYLSSYHEKVINVLYELA